MVAVAFVAAGYLGSSGAETVSDTRASPLASLDCAQGDLILQMRAEFGIDASGGHRTPFAAASEFVTNEYPHLSPTGPIERGRDATGTRYAYEVGASTVAVVTASEEGDSWHIVGFRACGGLLHPAIRS